MHRASTHNMGGVWLKKSTLGTSAPTTSPSHSLHLWRKGQPCGSTLPAPPRNTTAARRSLQGQPPGAGSCFSLTHQIPGHASFLSCLPSAPVQFMPCRVGTSEEMDSSCLGQISFLLRLCSTWKFQIQASHDLGVGGQQTLHRHRELAPTGLGGSGGPVLTQPTASTAKAKATALPSQHL